MSRGRCDYKRYRIKPQRGMPWTRAVQYMLRSVENVVVAVPFKYYGWQDRGERWQSFYFRIKDGVLQYRGTHDHWRTDDWANAAGHDFNEIRKFDAANLEPNYTGSLDDCVEQDIERLDLIEQRIEELQDIVVKIKRKPKIKNKRNEV